jgi:hypothetical protein
MHTKIIACQKGKKTTKSRTKKNNKNNEFIGSEMVTEKERA